jgi:DNA-binding FadR family transcriptional regulator
MRITRQAAGPRSRRSTGATGVVAGLEAGASLGRARLSDQIVDRLGQAIVDGAPVAALSSEAALALQYGVSRTVVREAIQRLLDCGLVQQRPKVGITLAPTTDWQYGRPELIRWLSGSPHKAEFLHHLTDLRKVLEPAIAERAATRATVADRESIEGADALLDQATRSRDVELFLRADAAWHEAVTEACQNPVMIDAMRRQREAIALSRDTTVRAIQLDRVTQRFRRIPPARRDELASLAYAMHHAVTTAILKGNARQAHRAMSDLIDGIDGVLLETFGR